MKRGFTGLVIWSAIAIAGCSGGGTSEPAANSPAAEAAATGQELATGGPAAELPTGPVEPKPQPAIPVNVPEQAVSTPEQVVTTFLTALKHGDKAATASLLTAKAWEETTRHQIEVDPQSAPNATYRVEAAEFIPNNPDGAHVTSVWTETFKNEETMAEEAITYDIVWVLRRQPDGWRIAGMALELVPGQPPAFLNFEDPADMLKKRDEAIAAMQPPAAETAAIPMTEGSPTPAPRVER
jgi:hypothetical protein